MEIKAIRTEADYFAVLKEVSALGRRKVAHHQQGAGKQLRPAQQHLLGALMAFSIGIVAALVKLL